MCLIIFLETFFCLLRVSLDRPFVGWMMHRPLMEAINDPCQRQATHPILGHVHDHRNNCEIKNGFAVGEYVYTNLVSNKININKPQGGFYLMPEFLIKKFSTSEEMCGNILKETGVALLPGSDFGFSKEQMIARLSFTDFDGEEFMKNLNKNEKIDSNLISKLAPKIVEGTKKLKTWSESA